MKQIKISVICVLFILFALAAPALAALVQAPVNPDFTQYILGKSAETKKLLSPAGVKTSFAGRSLSSDTLHGGAIPEVFDTSHIRTIRTALNEKTRDAALPAEFDLRTGRDMTGVRNQRVYGTCWSFAALASAESGMIVNNEGTKDLSEKHLSYFAYTDEGDETPSFTKILLDPEEDDIYDQGGNVSIAAAILGRWTGPVDETSCRYPGEDEDIRDSDPSVSTARVGQLRHVYRLSNRDGSGNIDNTEVKRAVMDGGAVYVRICWDNIHYNEDTFAYFASSAMGTGGHAVTIAGWDDNFAAENFSEGERPSGPGAWLVKNSWGLEWGEAGYFWLSYEDANISQISQFGIKPGTERNLYHHQYSYDPLGMVNASGTGNTTLYVAAVFQTEGDTGDNIPELVKAVGFYATAPGLSYRIEIRKNVSANNPSSGTSAASAQGTFTYAGYHTIEFPEAAAIVKGERFSVIVRVTGSADYTDLAPVEVYKAEYSEAASANAGETFYSVDGTNWTDIYTEDDTASICIKAFTNEVIPSKASNLLPIENTAGTSLNVLLKTRAFQATNGITHASTQWQVGINKNFENGIVLDTGDDDENLIEYTVANGVLDYGTTYYWRARFKGSNGVYSDWSDATSFRTKGTPAESSGGGGCNTGLLALLVISMPALVVTGKRSR